MIKEQITFEQFLEIEKKLDIRIGEVIEANRIPKSKKLLKLIVVFDYPSCVGATDGETRTVVTNIGDKFEPEHFVGHKMPFIMNLVPIEMMGVKSEAMIMVAEDTDGSIEYDTLLYPVGSKLM